MAKESPTVRASRINGKFKLIAAGFALAGVVIVALVSSASNGSGVSVDGEIKNGGGNSCRWPKQ